MIPFVEAGPVVEDGLPLVPVGPLVAASTPPSGDTFLAFTAIGASEIGGIPYLQIGPVPQEESSPSGDSRAFLWYYYMLSQ